MLKLQRLPMRLFGLSGMKSSNGFFIGQSVGSWIYIFGFEEARYL
jgi:hypothetical protein